MIGERVARMVVNLFTLLGEKMTVGGEPVHNARGAGDFWVELSCNAVCVLLVPGPGPGPGHKHLLYTCPVNLVTSFLHLS